MYRIDNSTAATSLPTPGAVGPNPNGYFTNGTPGVVPATIVDQDWANAMQEEGCNAVTASGQTLSKTNRTQLATAIAYSSAVAGSVRNLVMSVGTASASASITADEVVVSTALGALSWKLGSFSETINLATTGAGGMDTGAAPASGFVGIYAIYNPGSGATALLATNATSAAAPTIYGGANMPSGYTASALISVWPINGSSQFSVGYQSDREFRTIDSSVLTTSTQTSTLTSLSISGVVPKNAKNISGYVSLSSTASGNMVSNYAATSSGIAQSPFGSAGTISNNAFTKLPIVTPQTIYYYANVSAGTMTFIIATNGYTI